MPAGGDNLYISGLLNFVPFKFLFFEFKTESHNNNRNLKRAVLLEQENVNSGLSQVLSDNKADILERGTLSCGCST